MRFQLEVNILEENEREFRVEIIVGTDEVCNIRLCFKLMNANTELE